MEKTITKKNSNNLNNDKIMKKVLVKRLTKLFNLKIQCPVEGKFKDWNFLMVFKTFYNEPSAIHTITLFSIKK